MFDSKEKSIKRLITNIIIGLFIILIPAIISNYFKQIHYSIIYSVSFSIFWILYVYITRNDEKITEVEFIKKQSKLSLFFQIFVINILSIGLAESFYDFIKYKNIHVTITVSVSVLISSLILSLTLVLVEPKYIKEKE